MAKTDNNSNSGRAKGIIPLIMGAIFCKFFMYDVFQKVKNGAPEVWYSYTLMGLSVLGILIGLLQLSFGDRLNSIIQCNPENLSVKSIIFLVIIVAIILGICVWFDMQLSQYGYVKKYIEKNIKSN